MEYVPFLIVLGSLIVLAVGLMLLLERFVVDHVDEPRRAERSRRHRARRATTEVMHYGQL